MTSKDRICTTGISRVIQGVERSIYLPDDLQTYFEEGEVLRLSVKEVYVRSMQHLDQLNRLRDNLANSLLDLLLLLPLFRNPVIHDH